MKSVLISIKPKYCELIVNGEKTIEVRKTRPKIETPFKCYIYMSQGDLKDLGSYSELIYKNRMKVIGEFVCDRVDEYIAYKTQKGSKLCKNPLFYACLPIQEMCLTIEQVETYGKSKTVYGWHISDLKIYEKPKELSEFRPICKFEGKDAICALFCLNWKYDGGLFFECTRKVTRPPQSYMYVEEIETR